MGTFGYSMLTVVGALGMIVLLPATFFNIGTIEVVETRKILRFSVFCF